MSIWCAPLGRCPTRCPHGRSCSSCANHPAADEGPGDADWVAVAAAGRRSDDADWVAVAAAGRRSDDADPGDP